MSQYTIPKLLSDALYTNEEVGIHCLVSLVVVQSVSHIKLYLLPDIRNFLLSQASKKVNYRGLCCEDR